MNLKKSTCKLSSNIKHKHLLCALPTYRHLEGQNSLKFRIVCSEKQLVHDFKLSQLKTRKRKKKRFSSPYRLHFTLPDHFSIQPSFEADKGGNRKRKARLKIDQFPPTSRTNKSTDASVARRQTSGLKALPQKKRASLVSLVFTILLDAGARRKGSLAAGVNAP